MAVAFTLQLQLQVLLGTAAAAVLGLHMVVVACCCCGRLLSQPWRALTAWLVAKEQLFIVRLRVFEF
jgi:hypothetical protein